MELTAAALLHVVAVLLEVLLDEGFQQGVAILGEGALLDQELAQGFGLVQDPGVHGGDQGVAADEVHLQGQDAEKQVAIRGCAHGGFRSARLQEPGCVFPLRITDGRPDRKSVYRQSANMP